jgi:hypothetical protein
VCTLSQTMKLENEMFSRKAIRSVLLSGYNGARSQFTFLIYTLDARDTFVRREKSYAKYCVHLQKTANGHLKVKYS